MDVMELKAAIARSGKSNRALASTLGISEQAFYNKLQGDSEFKNSELKRLATELGLNMAAVNAIFFANEVN